MKKIDEKLSFLRTDMALEAVGTPPAPRPDKIKRTEITIDEDTSRRVGKPAGRYITVETGIVCRGFKHLYPRLIDALAEVLIQECRDVGSVLVVGLGNPRLTADALGSRVFDNLVVTRGALEETKVSLCALCPNVPGATGIESFDVIKGAVGQINPDLVIAVDSLASAAVGRIGSAFQFCSSGITPGSGVANHRMRLSRDTLGVDVLSIGVPLVVYATTIIAEAAGRDALSDVDNDIAGLIVTPKDIDVLAEECGYVVGSAINRAFLPELFS